MAHAPPAQAASALSSRVLSSALLIARDWTGHACACLMPMPHSITCSSMLMLMLCLLLHRCGEGSTWSQTPSSRCRTQGPRGPLSTPSRCSSAARAAWMRAAFRRCAQVVQCSSLAASFKQGVGKCPSLAARAVTQAQSSHHPERGSYKNQPWKPAWQQVKMGLLHCPCLVAKWQA